MGISTFVKAGKAAMDGKAALDNLDGKTAYGAGKSAATAPLKAWENVPRWVVRGLQFLFGLIVAGFYGHRIDVDRRAGAPQSGEWVFGVTIAGLSWGKEHNKQKTKNKKTKKKQKKQKPNKKNFSLVPLSPPFFFSPPPRLGLFCGP